MDNERPAFEVLRELRKNQCTMCIKTARGPARMDNDGYLILADGSGIGSYEADLYRKGREEGLAEIKAEMEDIRQRLKGYPDSQLTGENGLAAAVMNRLEHLEEENAAMKRIARWIVRAADEYTGIGFNLSEAQASKCLDLIAAEQALKEIIGEE